MSYQSDNLDLTILESGDPADLTTVSDNFDGIDEAYGDYLDDYQHALENVASIEGSTASKNYAVGSYLTKDGKLYKVTTAIASGETITVGTNVTAASLTEAIVSLQNSVANKASTADSIKNITRSGTIFTATRADGTTFTFTQQDNNSLTGVKGNAESNYRTGNVNLTPANIGAASANVITPASGTITFETSLVTSRGYKLYKIGQLVIIQIEISLVTNYNGVWSQIATLPSGFRPQISYRVPWTYADGGIRPMTGSIETGGAIKLCDCSKSALSSGSIMGLSTSFITS